MFDVLFDAFFKYRYNVSFYPAIRNSPHFKQFLKISKRFNYSVAVHFQHSNTDPITARRFVRIKFSFNIISNEFNILSWWKETLLFSVIEHRFAEQELKRAAFLTNLLSWVFRRYAKNFVPFFVTSCLVYMLSLVITNNVWIIALEQNFLRYFGSTYFCSSPGFHILHKILECLKFGC